MTTPTPLLTILSRTRYPFAVAHIRDGRIISTAAYQTTLADCYAEVQGWRSSLPQYKWIMVEQQEINGKSHWCAV